MHLTIQFCESMRYETIYGYWLMTLEKEKPRPKVSFIGHGHVFD
jgi:hypothetical protein